MTAADHSIAASPARAAPIAAAGRLERLVQRGKQPHDTAAGCRERAADDLARAQTMDTPARRAKLGESAAAWTRRGELLQRLETSFLARLAGAGK